MPRTFFLATDPVAKPRMTQGDKWAKRPAVLRYHAYRDTVRWLAKQAGIEPSSRFVVEFVIAPPRLTPKERARRLAEPHTLKPDVDNLLKGLMDCLWPHDEVVYKVLLSKRWGEPAGIHITTYQHDEQFP